MNELAKRFLTEKNDIFTACICYIFSKNFTEIVHILREDLIKIPRVNS